ncbi:MAG: PIN domain-containing protein [Chloroflexi bacterium]|nr:PIN domain-containing protein [Chloroflexota bacterium]
MGLLIDSGIFIVLERAATQEGALAEAFQRLPLESLEVSAVTVGELLAGVPRARTAEQRARREAFVERVLATFSVLPFDVAAARAYGPAHAALARAGALIGERDLLIAATALAHGHGVLTPNAAHFARVPGPARGDVGTAARLNRLTRCSRWPAAAPAAPRARRPPTIRRATA